MAGQGCTLLCTGDVHLGRHPTRIPDHLDGPAFSPRSVWQDVVREAIEREVDAVVLTGDVADRENRYFEAYGAFEAGAIELDEADVPVVAVAGNHDSEFLPRMIEDVDLEGLHLLGAGGTWERWTLEVDGDAAVRFDGWSFPQPHVASSPLADYDLEPAAEPQVGVLHADLGSPRSEYAPVTTSELRETGVACWLLGHLHEPGTRVESDPLALYPGSPQPLDPGERGVRGPWIVEVDAHGTVDVEQVPLASVCYDEVRVDASGAEDVQAVGSDASRALREHVQEHLEGRDVDAFLARLRLVGRTDAHGSLASAAERLREQLATRHGDTEVEVESVRVDTRPDVDLEALADGEGPVAYLAELLRALREGTASDEYGELIDAAHGAMRRAHGANAYDLLRREAGLEQPGRDDTLETLEREAELLLDALLRQKEEGQP